MTFRELRNKYMTQNAMEGIHKDSVRNLNIINNYLTVHIFAEKATIGKILPFMTKQQMQNFQ